jgi:hypothetical protein
MIDIPDLPYLMEHLEILTLDSKSQILFGSAFDPYSNPYYLPRVLVVKIYSDNSSLGTGFIFRLRSEQLFIVSANHVADSPFSSTTRFCFDSKFFISLMLLSVDLSTNFWRRTIK